MKNIPQRGAEVSEASRSFEKGSRSRRSEADLFAALGRHTFREGDGGDAPRLRNQDGTLGTAAGVDGVLQEILRDLCGGESRSVVL